MMYWRWVEVGVQTETHEPDQNDEFPAERRVAFTSFCRAHNEVFLPLLFQNLCSFLLFDRLLQGIQLYILKVNIEKRIVNNQT